MTEDEVTRREEYERQGGDAEQWGEPAARRPRRRLGAMVSIRLSADELDDVRRAAEEQGLSTSAFLRAVSLRAARGAGSVTAPHVTCIAPMTTSTLEAPREFISLSVSSNMAAWFTTMTATG